MHKGSVTNLQNSMEVGVLKRNELVATWNDVKLFHYWICSNNVWIYNHVYPSITRVPWKNRENKIWSGFQLKQKLTGKCWVLSNRMGMLFFTGCVPSEIVSDQNAPPASESWDGALWVQDWYWIQWLGVIRDLPGVIMHCNVLTVVSHTRKVLYKNQYYYHY